MSRTKQSMNAWNAQHVSMYCRNILHPGDKVYRLNMLREKMVLNLIIWYINWWLDGSRNKQGSVTYNMDKRCLK